ncbi:hypothetical protein GC102_31125 [Paenibacillus sp. LMG 31460]|uniref:Uncharacterized protein n=1 Tax=Paenibacillus germinis TaxID=2654979 RepID=A0ABX1Z9Y3_9BACL|nr:hypothetical protein [Paenibacillus germinis]
MNELSFEERFGLFVRCFQRLQTKRQRPAQVRCSLTSHKSCLTLGSEEFHTHHTTYDHRQIDSSFQTFNESILTFPPRQKISIPVLAGSG